MNSTLQLVCCSGTVTYPNTVRYHLLMVIKKGYTPVLFVFLLLDSFLKKVPSFQYL